MKRIAIKLVLFLVLGAVVNVGVAWGCAVWVPVHRSELMGFHLPVFSTKQVPHWWVTWYERSGAIRYHLCPDFDEASDSDMTLELPSWVAGDHEPPVAANWKPDNANVVVSDARGWPFLALAYEFEIVMGTGGHFVVDVHRGIPLRDVHQGGYLPRGAGRIKIRPDFDADTALPFAPILPGFLINSRSVVSICRTGCHPPHDPQATWSVCSMRLQPAWHGA